MPSTPDDEKTNSKLFSAFVVLVLSLMIALSISFERIKDHLEGLTEPGQHF